MPNIPPNHMMSLWGRSEQPSESQTRFLGSLCQHPESAVQLPFEMGEYLVTRMLGRGGMGIVFQGEHRRMQRRVAIKVLNSALAQTPAAQEQFLGEIRAVARLLHPRIVTAFDAGQFGSIIYLVMEYVDGVPLHELVASQGPLPVDDAIALVRQAAEGLAHAHHSNVIHRDVKPSNMMVGRNGELKLLDLGLASLAVEVIADEQTSQTQTICGTPEFMAPEQFDHGDLTPAVDVYALGCTLFHILVGRSPYQGSFFELMRSHCTGAPPSLVSLGIERATQLQPLLDGMLAKRPRDRVASMDEVIALLDLLRRRPDADGGGSGSGGASWIAENVRSAIESVGDPQTSGNVPIVGQVSDTSGSGYAETRMVSSTTVCGIDLGGRTITASLSGPSCGRVTLPLESDRSHYLRSAVATSRSRGAVFGDQAWTRLIGGSRGCENAILSLRDAKPIRWGDESFASSLPMAMILRHIRDQTEPHVGSAAVPSVITVPASFGQMPRRRIREAAEAAGWENVRLVDRNLAIALSQFSLGGRGEPPTLELPAGAWLVVSLTDLAMEMALLSVSEQRIQVRSVTGDVRLGGPRWARRLRRFVRQKLSGFSDSSSGSSDGQAVGQLALMLAMDAAIEALPTQTEPPLDFKMGFHRVRGVLNTPMILKSCGDLVQSVGELLGQTLAEAGIDGEHIVHCVTAGPLARCAPIASMMGLFGIDCDSVQVDQIDVATHVAAWADQVDGRRDRVPRLIACNARDVGIRCGEHKDNGDVELVIPRLTALPAKVLHPLTSVDHQSMVATVFESQPDQATVWDEIERHELNGVSASAAQGSVEMDEQGNVRCEVIGASATRRRLNEMTDEERQSIERQVGKVSTLWRKATEKSQNRGGRRGERADEAVAGGSSF